MPNRYSVVCRTCLYQSFHSSRWEANIEAQEHLRDNPTHSVTVVEESLGAKSQTWASLSSKSRMRHLSAV